MDPNQALTDLFACIESGDMDGALECFDNLDAWIRSGGFVPDRMQEAIDAVMARG